MVEEISNEVIIYKSIAGILGVIIPTITLIIWKKKKLSIKPAVVGAVTFVVFSQVLEGVPKALLFMIDSKVSSYIWTHPWAYVLAGCLLAGVFEEVGRYVAFRFFLKNEDNKEDAITYGIGHGGIESILVLGMGAINSIALVFMINNGTLQESMLGMSVAQVKSLEFQVSVLAGYGFVRMLLEVFERIVAMSLHISLSVVVFKAVHKKKIAYLLLAIILHAIFDIPAAMCQSGVIGIALAEVILAISAVAIAIVANKLWRN